MVNTNDSDAQSDAHLLEFELPDIIKINHNSSLVLIDAADDRGVLSHWLWSKGIRTIPLVVITHPHKDHYGGLRLLKKTGMNVQRVKMNFPSKVICDKEIPWGCDYADVSKLFEEFSGVIEPARSHEVLFSKNGIELKILYALDGVHTPIGQTDINDMSLQILLSVGKTRVLFTGDLNAPLGEYLAKVGENLQADILKVPHHGTEGAAPNSFFDRVNPAVALVPSPQKLWLSPRSERIRPYFSQKGLPTYVSGFHGNVSVLLYPDSFEVVPERLSPPLVVRSKK